MDHEEYLQKSEQISKLKMQKHGDVYTRSSMYSTNKCPYCNRMFAASAALRHIPICATIINKPKTLDDKKCSNYIILINDSPIIANLLYSKQQHEYINIVFKYLIIANSL